MRPGLHNLTPRLQPGEDLQDGAHAKNSDAPYRSSVAGVRVYRRRLGNSITKVRLPPAAEERRSAQANPQPQ